MVISPAADIGSDASFVKLSTSVEAARARFGGGAGRRRRRWVGEDTFALPDVCPRSVRLARRRVGLEDFGDRAWSVRQSAAMIINVDDFHAGRDAERKTGLIRQGALHKVAED